MPTRAEILETLAASQERLIAYYQALTPEECERGCTASEAPDGTPWRPKDHLTHLASIERAFQGMVRRTLQGHADPTGFNSMGNATTREEIVALIHQHNQDHVDAHREDSLETMFANLAATREKTLALLAQCTDEQLATPVTGAPWSDGTIGGVLITNAHHAAQHMAWIEEGLHQHYMNR